MKYFYVSSSSPFIRGLLFLVIMIAPFSSTIGQTTGFKYSSTMLDSLILDFYQEYQVRYPLHFSTLKEHVVVIDVSAKNDTTSIEFMALDQLLYLERDRFGTVISFFYLEGIPCVIRTKIMELISVPREPLISFLKEVFPLQYQMVYEPVYNTIVFGQDTITYQEGLFYIMLGPRHYRKILVSDNSIHRDSWHKN